MKRLSSLFLSSVVTIAALVSLTGCPSGDPCGDPIYAPGSTDEAWLTMVDGEKSVKTDDTNGAKITSPSEGQELSGDGAAPLFSWTSTLSASLQRPSSSTAFASLEPRSERPVPLRDRLLDLVIPAAHAHEPPVTGPIHVLQITVPGEQCPVRVITGKNEWQVGSDTWTLLNKHRGETLSMTITSAYLTENRITEGPYRPSSPRTFTVK